ncbi:MAG: NAD(P)(+) transhydrogenase (Re/Si-specific) subunit beta [Calditrichaeota bacterium]|nr:MAG: NAD(P)(+) transhydrogenase (Re/Si-specific) subunit beta [Calditrichota bacterium]
MSAITNLVYLVAAILFIFGLKNLSSPKTARRGNLLALLGMLLAIVMTLLDKQILDFTWIIVGLVIGSAIGAYEAKTVQMTAMPQMVALFNGFGGAASALVAYAEYVRLASVPELNVTITMVLSVLIGTVTWWGSLVAFAKLQGIMKGAPIVLPLHQIWNILLLIAIAVLGVFWILDISQQTYLLLIVVLSTILGFLLVIPIGGADMPVVISLLNSYSGLAAAMTGFVLSNNVLIVSGALVGASGLILTNIMCKAMNRSLANVLFGAVGTDGGGGPVGDKKQVTEYTYEDAAMVLESAQSIIIVPGYGLAVAQAQHVLHELATLLMERGAKVSYAIHPVAGRMPGHMNVLLAEANVPYDMLHEMDEINEDFQNTDLALVIGANDVINPAARYLKNSPLYGMPILNVDKARSIMIIKRSLSPGFAGVDNELFYNPKTMMVFGDAKKVLTELLRELKS